MGVSGLVCAAASYLRLVIVPETVRDKAVEVFPSWVNETFLSLLPALNPDVLNLNLYYNATEHLVVARQVYDEYDGAKPKHPVVIVPGFVNTGLELWKSKPCIAKKTQFRQRMWGTPAMAKAFFHNRTCWLEHMALNATSGEDPDGIVLRPMAGIDSVDWFMPGYFVWGRMIEALGEIGYTGSNIHAHSYDWRLSPEQLEKRDGYFTK
jgi:Lecithin:cholesterol acyltransferase.